MPCSGWPTFCLRQVYVSVTITCSVELNFRSCPIGCKQKHSQEITKEKQDLNALIQPTTQLLATLSAEDRTKRLQHELKVASELANARRETEKLERNRACFDFSKEETVKQEQQPVPTTTPSSSGSSSPTSGSPVSTKRDYFNMTKEQLLHELELVKTEESALKKRKLNILFNLQSEEDQLSLERENHSNA